MSDYRIYVRGANRTRAAQIDDFNRLDIRLRFNAPGAWVLELPAGTAAAVLLTAVRAGIIVVRDDTTILSGPVRGLERVWDTQGDRLVASGYDDLAWLADRLAHPDPTGALSGTPLVYGSAYDVQGPGAAETVIRAYVNRNAGPGALGARQVEGLSLATDTGLGTTVTGRARFQNLLDLSRQLALAGGDLGFRVVQVGNDLTFQVYQPADKTASAVFSRERGNLRSFEYGIFAAAGNYVYVGGGGEGVARTFVEAGEGDSMVRWNRIENFRDRRDTTDATELRQTALEELQSTTDRTALSIQTVDIEGQMFIDDYQLGDRVTVVVDGSPIQDVIREVGLSLTPSNAEQVVPVIGTPGAGARDILGLFNRLARVQATTRDLERR